MMEFKMQTTGYSAEYGRLAGGTMNMALKSGGNSLHGSLFEFVRNDAFDARGFFDAAKTKLRRNQFSRPGQAGLHPKLYNGINRTFFLFNWEGYRQGERSLRHLHRADRVAARRRLPRVGGRQQPPRQYRRPLQRGASGHASPARSERRSGNVIPPAGSIPSLKMMSTTRRPTAPATPITLHCLERPGLLGQLRGKLDQRVRSTDSFPSAS
jgi:hypothetical protein